MPRILALTANPDDTTWLRLDREMREVRRRLSMARASSFEFIVEPAAESENLLRLLQEHDPDILHFSGHGTRGGIVLENGRGEQCVVPAADLEDIFATLRPRTRCVVLNSCYSEQQAVAIRRTVECVVGMSEEVPDEAAIAFSAGFYEGLAFGRDTSTAFKLGCHQVALMGVSGRHIPRLLLREDASSGAVVFSPRPSLWAEFLPDEHRKPRTWQRPKGRPHFDIRLYVRDAPREVIGAVYQLDPSFAQPFRVVTPVSGEEFSEVIRSYADFEIRAMLWTRSGGEGVRSRLVEALRKGYPNGAEPEADRAIQQLVDAER